MAKGRFVKKMVENTTNNHTKGIINFLLSEGHSASRINTQGQFEPVNEKYSLWHNISAMVYVLRKNGLVVGFWRRSGSREGYADISVCLKCKSGIGLFHAIDFKGKGDKLREGQKDFKQEVEQAGGIFTEASSLYEYQEYYFKQIKPILERL